MSSRFYLAFAKIFNVSSWLNMIVALVAASVNNKIITLASIILALSCATLTCIFYIIYVHTRNKEDLEVIKEIDRQIRGQKIKIKDVDKNKDE